MTVSLSASGVMARAWAIFAKTYNFPAIPLHSIGRHCFTWALRQAWNEAKFAAALAATSSEALQAQVDRIDRELSELKYRGFSCNVTKRQDELHTLARPLIAELLRRSVAAFSLKLAA